MTFEQWIANILGFLFIFAGAVAWGIRKERKRKQAEEAREYQERMSDMAKAKPSADADAARKSLRSWE